jgi:hypothetical protein
MAAGPHRISGVASTAIKGILESPGTGVVLGSSSHAVWLLVDGSVLVVSTVDATRLPNGIEIAVDAASDPFRSIQHGEAVTMGDGRISFTGLTVEARRWWDSRPALPATTVEGLAGAIGSLSSDVPDLDGSRLRAALADASVPGLLAAAEGLLGLGTGLTPEGDDYLAGAIAALATLGPAVGSVNAGAMLAGAATPLADLAVDRTTTFSAALIHHAQRGEVAAPAGDLLRALAGRGDIAQSHGALSRVGHSSGPALAAGIILGARSLIEQER